MWNCFQAVAANGAESELRDMRAANSPCQLSNAIHNPLTPPQAGCSSAAAILQSCCTPLQHTISSSSSMDTRWSHFQQATLDCLHYGHPSQSPSLSPPSQDRATLQMETNFTTRISK